MSVDFNTFTEVEEIDDIQKTATHVDFIDRRNRTTYLFRDFGAGYFTDFIHWLDITRQTHGDSASAYFWMLSNALKGEQIMRDDDDPYIAVVCGGTNPNTRIQEHDALGVFHSGPFKQMVLTTKYYIRIEKVGASFYVDWFSTANLRAAGGRGDGDWYSDSMVLQADYSMRYLYIGQTHDDNTAPIGSSDMDDLIFWGSEDLLAQFDVGQSIEDLPAEFIVRHPTSVDLKASFDAQASLNMPGEFIVVNQSAIDLLAGFEVVLNSATSDLHGEFVIRRSATLNLAGQFIIRKSASVDLLAEFRINQGSEDLHARFRVENIYDLRGTAGIAFYWQGANNPPESIVDFIVESPTGFWVAEFYDGPASLRYVFIPWTQFRETGLDGSRPDMSRVDGFIWIVHTDGRRRIDYIHAPVFGDLFAFFEIRHVGSPRDLKAVLSIRRTATPLNLAAAFSVRSVGIPLNLLAGLDVRQSDLLNLPAEFVVRDAGTVDLPAEFVVGYIGVPVDLLAEFVVRNAGTADLPAEFVVEGIGIVDLPAEFIVGGTPVSVDLLAEFFIRNAGTADLPAEFVVGTYFEDNGTHNPLYDGCSPNTVYYNGKTYIVWQGDAGYDPYITAYTHSTGLYSTRVKVGTNPLAGDSHGCPVILIDDSGYIHIFYGSHVSNQKYSISTNPEDITAWSAQPDVETLATYPEPIMIGNGDIYLFMRKSTGAGGKHQEVYIKSDDGGASWGAANIIIEVNSNGDAIYAYTEQLYGNNIHIIWRYHDGTNSENVYHAYLNTADGKMYSMAGVDLGASITKAEADANCLVVNSGALVTCHMSQKLDANGYPYIIYCITTAIGGWDYCFVRWTGAAWTVPEIITSTDHGNNGMDLIVHSSTSITAFLIDDGGAGQGGNIDEWSWNGAVWSKTKTIFTEAVSGRPLIVPQVVKDYEPELVLVFCQYGGANVTGLKLYAYNGTSLVP